MMVFGGILITKMITEGREKMFTMALCQMRVVDDKKRNLAHAETMIGEAAQQGAQLVMLPEMFNCPYDNAYFPLYAEEVEGNSVRTLAECARRNGVYLVGGSLPEIEADKLYNTCYVFDSQGKILGKYRKMHLFDVYITGGAVFQESAVLTAGNKPLVVQTELGKIGVGICFDIRFPELARLLTLEGAEMICLPGAFNMTTGPAHWQLSVRMRAVDNQVYFAAASPARDTDFSYVAYGHSMISDPWGTIVGELGAEETILYGAVDLTRIRQVRQELPLLAARRKDIYRLEY